MSLRTRIAAVAGLAVAVAVLGAAVTVYVAIRSELRGEVDRSLRERATAFRDPGPMGDEGLGGPPPPLRERLRPPGDGPPAFGGASGFVQLVKADGSATGPPGGRALLPVDEATLEIAAARSGERLADAEVDSTHVRVLTAGTPFGAVQVARPLDEVDSVLDRVLIVLIVVGLAGIALAAGLGALVARTALAPVARFTRRTEALTADPDPSQRMEEGGRDELGRLAASFNATLDALESSIAAQRHLVADAGHELRTPIASLRANIQVLEDAERLPPEERAGLRADIIEELDELTSLVGDVVELARGAKPAEALDDVRLDLVAQALAERFERRAGDVNIQVEAEPTLVRGDPERIGRAVSNLLDNACKWSPPGGTVGLCVKNGRVSVRDRGPGFDEGDLPRVFERFYRSDSARSMPGSGLGLAIVRQTAEDHGGWAEAANAPGGGARVAAGFGPVVPLPDEAISGTPPLS